jgi:hypothetical protein
MHDSNAGHSHGFESATERAVWEYLNTDEGFARLETATIFDRPALEGVAHQLQQRFGADVEDDEWRPTVASMVREVMTLRGYALIKRGERFRDRDLFAPPQQNRAS